MTTSSRNQDQGVWVCWADLPDPRDAGAPSAARTEVVLDCRGWKHIVGKHVLPGREPWAEIFTAEVLRQLLGLEDPCRLAEPAVAAAVEKLGDQVRAALERPLVLLGEARPLGRSGDTPHRWWILVLPAGATAYVHQTQKRNRLASCYFPAYAVVIADRGLRWRRVVARLVLRYGVVDTQRNALVLPTEDTVKLAPSKGPTRELHSAIRFVTPASWGFCPELAGCPWRGRLGEWQAAEAPSPGRRHRLKRRRKSPHDEESEP